MPLLYPLQLGFARGWEETVDFLLGNGYNSLIKYLCLPLGKQSFRVSKRLKAMPLDAFFVFSDNL